MKKMILISLLAAMTLVLFGCFEGEAGPAGADANETCITCHNDGTDLVARQQQYAMSTHANGGNADYGNRTSCAGCHTHEGFMEAVEGGTNTVTGVEAAFETPTQPNCRTCHNIHVAYDSTDWTLTVAEGANIMFNVDSAEYAFGKANVCASCHQPRGSVPATTDVEISKYYGPHHGPQGAVIQGVAAYSFTGQTATLPATGAGHGGISNSCVACHMANAADNLAVESGGHQFGMRDQSDNLNTVGCTACHSDEDVLETKITTLQDSIAVLLTDAETLLTAKGLIISDYSKDTVSAADAGALWNYKLILEDRSKGVHNPTATKAILENTIEYLTANP